MNYLIFSDIHGRLENIEPFVLNNKFDYIFCSGDLFGYFPPSNNLIKFLTDNNIHFILGNHDLYFLREYNERLFNDYFSSYIPLMISNEQYVKKYGNKNFVKQVKHNDILNLFNKNLIETFRIDDKKICLCHGSPYQPFNQYVFANSNFIEELFKDFDFDILILGHTHKPYIFKKNSRYIVNPGSVTLPRGEFKKPSVIVGQFNPFRLEIIFLDQKLNFKKVSRTEVTLL